MGPWAGLDGRKISSPGWARGPVWTGGKSRPLSGPVGRSGRAENLVPWVGPWAGLDGRKISSPEWARGPVWTGGKSRPHRDSIPDRPARSSVAIQTELPGPPFYVANLFYSWFEVQDHLSVDGRPYIVL